MLKKDIIFTLYQKPQTVFSSQELSLLFPAVSENSLRRRLHYFARSGKLRRLARGLYAKIDFNPLEAAGKIYSPSYISLETVLLARGVIFQNYKRIFAVSYLTREVKLAQAAITVCYRKIKNEVLFNKAGVEEKNGWFEACPERAFLDAVFLYRNYHFDNLGGLDWTKIRELSKIYKREILQKRVEEYYKIYKENE